MAKVKHLSLFNGIGGFQLAAHWAGWENVAHCEIDEWCNKVVAQHFPHSKCYTDVNYPTTKDGWASKERKCKHYEKKKRWSKYL